MIAVFAILWSTRVASRFVTVRLKAKHILVEEQRSLLAYRGSSCQYVALLSLY